jgi:transcriptional regulator with XRE-family HTH domain
LKQLLCWLRRLFVAVEGERRSGCRPLIFRLVAWRQPGQLYRALRKARGLTQVQLAAELGVSQPFVSQVQRGVRRLPPVPNPDPEGTWWADRALWDELLALGEPTAGEGVPLYAVGVLNGLALPSLTEPLVVVRDRDTADAVAEKLAAAGVGGVAVVPMWSSWVEQRGGAAVADADALWQALREVAG